MSNVVWLAEIVAWDPVALAETTLRYGTAGHVTGPAESPASTVYDARLKQPADIRRFAFVAGSTQGRNQIAAGDVTLHNEDGALDGLLDYGFDGRTITLRKGTAGAAYPSGFPAVFTGTMEQVEFVGDDIRIKMKDAAFALNVPLQPNTYAGDNVLPDGLEGVESDLKGKPKPWLVGTVKNVAPPCVNTSKLIYQVNDGPVASVDAVYDRGINLVSTYFEAQSSGFGSDSVNHVYFGGTLYVASGDAGKISTSPDGVTWTPRTSNFAGAACVGGCYGNGRYLVVGGVSGTSSAVSISTDGVTWTRNAAAEAAFGAQQMIGATYSERLGLYVIVGLDGKIITSPDTVTWTPRASGTPGSLLAIVDGEGVLVAGGGSAVIITSPDGVTWSAAVGSGAVSEIAYNRREGFLAVYNAARYVLTSRDGLTWRLHPDVLPGTGCQGTAYGAGLFVTTGGVTRIMVATDPTQLWEPADNDGGMASAGATGRMVAYGPSGWVVVGTLGFIALASARRTDYASAADLEDESMAPRPGQIGVYPAGGMFRLGSPPAGLITCDPTQGATAADRTAGALFTAVLTKAGKTAADWVAADVTALDTADNAELGYWYDGETVAEALDLIAGTVGAWWGPRADGKHRIVRFTAPSGTPVASFTANDLIGQPKRIAANDIGRGLPVWRTVLRYARNYVVQASDLAFGVSDARRASVAKEWREAAAEAASVQTAHPLAIQTDEPTLYAVAADATDEAVRRQALRGVRRDRIEFVVHLNATTATLDIGDVVSLDHSRLGLSGGALLRIIGLEPRTPVNRDDVPKLTITGWK